MGARIRLPAGLSLVAFLATLPLPRAALPQTPAPPEREEIVVTGEKRDFTLFETTSSVDVIRGDELAELNGFDLQDALQLLPNVSEISGGEGFALRGVGAFSVAGGPLTASPLASFVLDGAVLSEFGIRVGPLEAWDLEQIEVLRGPQSTNLGRNALAGAVVMVSREPRFEWSGDARAVYGSYDTRALSLSTGGPLIDEQLAFRVSYDSQHTDGFVRNARTDSDQAASSSNRTLRTKLRFEPARWPGLSAGLTLFHSENRSGDDVVATRSLPSEPRSAPPFADPVAPHARRVFANIPGSEDHDTSFATLQLEQDLGPDWSLHSTSALIRSRYDRVEDDDREPRGGRNARIRENRDLTWTQELRLRLQGERLRGDVGVYYFRSQAEDASDFSTGENPATGADQLTRRLAGFDQSTRNWAVFSNVDFDLLPQVTLLAGARYDAERKRVDQRQRFVGSPDGPSLQRSDGDFSAFLPKLGLRVFWTENLMTSLTWQKAYRAGGSDLRAGTPNDYDPEFTKNWDFALRYRALDGALELNAHAFRVDWKDQQILISPEDGSDPLTINAGSSELRGGEISLSLRPGPSWLLFANFGWLRTDFVEFPLANGTDLRGNRFPNAPRNSYALGIRYRPERGWMGSLTADFLDEAFLDPFNRRTRESRFLLSARIGYRLEHLSVSLFARNLLDEEYVTADLAPRLPYIVKIGAPRHVGVEVRGQF